MKEKFRLVARGCLQMSGADYNKTLAPFLTIVTIWLIFAVTAALDLEIEQIDVVTTFRNGDLNEDIYMAIHEGLKNSSNANKVCKLLKSIYRLKQSRRMWYFIMHELLIEIGFKVALTIHASTADTRHLESSSLLVCRRPFDCRKFSLGNQVNQRQSKSEIRDEGHGGWKDNFGDWDFTGSPQEKTFHQSIWIYYEHSWTIRNAQLETGRNPYGSILQRQVYQERRRGWKGSLPSSRRKSDVLDDHNSVGNCLRHSKNLAT